MSLETIRAKYPYLAYAMADPEVADVLTQADREGWPDSKTTERLMQTNWYKTSSQSQRDYHSIANSDPASFWQLVQQKADQITTMAARLGLDLTPDQIYDAAKAALYFGRSEADIQRALVYGSGATISNRSSIQQQVKQVAADYFITLAPETVADWTRKISSGQFTTDNLRADMAAWAKDLYPHLAQVLDSGRSIAQYAAPYRQSIASMLELNPDSIDFHNDARWKSVLSYDDGSGNVRSMTLTEAERFARAQPEWARTKNASDQAAGLGQVLGESFGKVA